MNMEQDSQQGSGEQQKKREKKGYMALRNNVFDLKLELWQYLTPLEYFLLDVIIDKTIKWRETEARIEISEFVRLSKQQRNHVYVALKELENKKVILKRKNKNQTIYALNEDYFGGLLIKRHEEARIARSKLKCVVDNSKKLVRKWDRLSPRYGLVKSRFWTNNDIQKVVMIKKSTCLKTLLKDISLKPERQRETFSLIEREPTAEEIKESRAKIHAYAMQAVRSLS